MRVAVAGGTGVVGRHVVARLRDLGHEPVVLARSTGVDLLGGAGLRDALAGCSAVIDVSNVVTTRASASRRFFEAATHQLLRAGADARVRHHVALSIVNCDRVDFGYYAGKRAQEALVLGPSAEGRGSVLRATQFHEFAGQVLDRTPGPVAVVPRMRIQPVAAADVAAALADLALGPPVGMATDLAGPEPRELVDLARLVAGRSGRRLVGIRLPGRAGRQIAGGDLLPGPSAQLTSLGFEEWLARRT